MIFQRIFSVLKSNSWQLSQSHLDINTEGKIIRHLESVCVFSTITNFEVLVYISCVYFVRQMFSCFDIQRLVLIRIMRERECVLISGLNWRSVHYGVSRGAEYAWL